MYNKICVGEKAKEFSFVVPYSFPAHLTFSARFSISIAIGRLFSVTKKENSCIQIRTKKCYYYYYCYYNFGCAGRYAGVWKWKCIKISRIHEFNRHTFAHIYKCVYRLKAIWSELYSAERSDTFKLHRHARTQTTGEWN